MIDNSVILEFTFHNVSIKTGVGVLTVLSQVHLHSTMFLLKPAGSAEFTHFCIIIYIPQCFY